VVVSQEVEEPVDDEERDLAREGVPPLAGLGFRRLHRDVDLAQEELAVLVLEVAGLGERKGQHVGRAVDLEEIAIQGAKVLVSGDDERDGGPGKTQDPERAREERSKSGRS
jgi:hypothetical protein